MSQSFTSLSTTWYHHYLLWRCLLLSTLL